MSADREGHIDVGDRWRDVMRRCPPVLALALLAVPSLIPGVAQANGRFNNSRGALLGGLIVGVCENLAAAYISPAYKDAVALVIFMVVILFKPQGLLGKKVERKV